MSPARLYAALIGAALVIGGIIGFFYTASFATGAADVAAETDEVFGILAVNGWHNLVHIAFGLTGLALAGSDSGAKLYSVLFGVIYLVLAIWGFADGDGVIVGLVPLNDEDNVLHLVLGLLGLGAAAATQGDDAGRAVPA